MTKEQRQVAFKCKRMLELAFPDLTGHVKYNMVDGKAKVTVCYVNLKES